MSERCPTPGKKSYTSVNGAVRHRNQLLAKGGSVDLWPYKCRCGKWHVGHSYVSLNRRIRQARRDGVA